MARVLCALSGGVDSSVAAFLLKEQGHDVVGVFMRNGVTAHAARARSCCSASDAADAARVADKLCIPFYALDFAEEFAGIIDRFVADYRRGRTPSPCILCNQQLKFGQLFSFAHAAGAASVATGHYARTRAGRLLRAADPVKDQTYYLFGIARERLPSVRFPIGDLRKAEVRDIARRAGLPVADKAESMEICFVPTDDYRDLLRERAGATGTGVFVDLAGRVVGEHAGIEGFTVGQRRRLPAGPHPRYVVAIDPVERTVAVGGRADLLCAGASLTGVNWLAPERPAPGDPIAVVARLRARHDGVRASATLDEADGATLRFFAPEGPVTPGQAAVLYRGDECVGGGWIDAGLPVAV